MRTKQLVWLTLTGLTLALLAGPAAAAENPPAVKHGDPGAAAWADLLHVVGKLPMSSLSGLVVPEKVGLLTDNQCHLHDNEAHVLSDNEADVELLSGNQTTILSGIRILSGLSLEVNITINTGADKPPAAKPKKAHRKRKPRKPRKHKAAAKSKRR